jgi:hypothetical protein
MSYVPNHIKLGQEQDRAKLEQNMKQMAGSTKTNLAPSHNLLAKNFIEEFIVVKEDWNSTHLLLFIQGMIIWLSACILMWWWIFTT